MQKKLQAVELLIVFSGSMAHIVVGRVQGQLVVMEVCLKG
jgi:hypothetical protein